MDTHCKVGEPQNILLRAASQSQDYAVSQLYADGKAVNTTNQVRGLGCGPQRHGPHRVNRPEGTSQSNRKVLNFTKIVGMELSKLVKLTQLYSSKWLSWHVFYSQ